jgi:outer membrane lipoprotein-sorting protein
LLWAAVLSSSATANAAGEATTDARDAEDLIASAVARYANASAYEIDFAQESYWALADSTQLTTGTLAVVPPRSISIRYDDGGRIVADGDSLRVYVPATNQFFSARMDSTDLLFDPVRLLSAYAPDADDPFGRNGRKGGGRTVVTLRPGAAAVEPVRLDVEIDAATGLLSGLVAYSSGGDRTRYTIHDTRLNARIPDSTFKLSPPEGADILRGSPYGG